MVYLRSSTSFTVSSPHLTSLRGERYGLSEDCVKADDTHTVLTGRTPETSVVLQQKFTQFSMENGILPENIAILPKNGTLLPTQTSVITTIALCSSQKITDVFVYVFTAECPEA